MISNMTIETLKSYGVGRRKLDDNLFAQDKPPPRLGIFDLDEENLCHEVIKTTCSVPGCVFTAETLLEFENHYNGYHRYVCAQCKKILPSPHILDLHIQESHDSFFAVMAERKPSYYCYIEDCKEKFMNADERMDHCVKIHKLPKDFRFERNQKGRKPKIKKEKENVSMEVDNAVKAGKKKKFTFNNSRQKGFVKYEGRKFTDDDKMETGSVNMDDIAAELKLNLPE
ncbi:unnamed protein product [Diatraea saccharalis]|uniref:C2H2-type domain-containing protein n=1 Tax=Diatraea saccharalis TaxID=40085 RepID=A0A9N9R8E5_9NEOP|nr:unnamed protein product [Diatraea saccharalis]